MLELFVGTKVTSKMNTKLILIVIVKQRVVFYVILTAIQLCKERFEKTPGCVIVTYSYSNLFSIW